MREYIEVKCVDPDELRLKKTVLLAYTDLTAAGSRALLGIDMRMEYFKMDIPELVDNKPACDRDDDRELAPTQQQFQPLQVLNCKYEEFSVIVVNTVVAANRCHYVANRIMDLCAQSGVERILLFSVLRLDLPDSHKQTMYENCFNSKPVTEQPSIPRETLICDPLLSVLLQMLQVEQIPTNLLTLPGHKGALGPATHKAKEQIKRIQDRLSSLYKLSFDQDLSFSLVHKGKNDTDLDMASMIYM